MSSCVVTLPDVPCLDCVSNGWERSCPDCYVDAGFTRVACKAHRQPCAAHSLVPQPVTGPRAAEPVATESQVKVLTEAPTLWVAGRYRGAIRYERGICGSSDSYETRVYVDGCPSADHSAPTRRGLIEALRSKYSDYREVPGDGRPLLRWLDGDLDICKTLPETKAPRRPKQRRPTKKARKKAEALDRDRKAELADIKRRVELGVVVALASSAAWQEEPSDGISRRAAANRAAKRAAEQVRRGRQQ